MLKPLLRSLGDLVYPPNCLLCRKYLTSRIPTDVLCPQCWQTIEFNIPPFCLKCSRHLGKKFSRPKCTTCQKKHLHFDFAWGACLYNEALKELIHKFKYHQKTYLKNLFGELMLSFIDKYNLDIVQFDVIAPIPLHATRLRERGFNQSQLLAQKLCEHYRLPMSMHNLVRIRPTKSQVLLDQKERWTNTQGAFRIKDSKMFRAINVLLVDDLLTTGATASEAALTLKEAGANTVGLLTPAIASDINS